MTSWAAIIAVPTLITGYYGMNVPFPGSGETSGAVVSGLLVVVLSMRLYMTVPETRLAVTAGSTGFPAGRSGYGSDMSLCTIAPRPLRHVRAPQLLAWLRTFDDALADIDDDLPPIAGTPPRRPNDSGLAA